jgi:CBS domain containing-hemolysin-like protein
MSEDLWLIALAVVLVLLAALLVSAETAIVRVSRGRIEEIRKDQPSRAGRLLVVLDDRPRYVNVLLLLSSAAMVSATVIVTYLSVDVLALTWQWSITLALVLAGIVMLIVTYVAIGVIPRIFGQYYAEQIALAAARPARACAMLLGPITEMLIVLGNAFTLGRGDRKGPFASETELRELVDLAEADQLIEDDERQMIHSVFELGDTFAKEVMVPRTEMVFIEQDKALRQALSLGLRSGFSRIPVIGESADDIVGMVYLKDVVRRVFDDRTAEDGQLVRDLMREPYFVPDSKPVDELLRDMQSARVHLAIVIDEYGGTAGLVTIEDILEEIVGEIADEHDTQAPDVEALDEHTYRVSARLHLDDFAELVGIELDSEREDVDTVLGLMAKRLGRVPIPGATIEESGWLLVAEQGAGRRKRIGTVRAQFQNPGGSDDQPE